MLRNLKDMDDFEIKATDGTIGQIKDFYFDDDTWTVRYLVVETGSWLDTRMVLISPIAVRRPDWSARTLPVSLTLQQVQNSPDIETDKPVSRQNEESYLGYYGYPTYWGGDALWGAGMVPYAMDPTVGVYTGYGKDSAERERDLQDFLRDERARHRNDDPHLRSCAAVSGYHIHATDGDIGHVAGYLADDDSWALRYLIVNTSNWWMGHQVLVAPRWITGVHWTDHTVSVDLTREAIKSAPAYDATQEWTPDLDVNLQRHYASTAHRGAAAPPEREI